VNTVYFVRNPATNTFELSATSGGASINTTGSQSGVHVARVCTSTITGATTLDWSKCQNIVQNEPTGTITYTFTNPSGPCHCQLFIDSDGTSTAQTFTWPATVVWLGTQWSGVSNKKAVINFWFDGVNFYGQGSNQA
jgi:hypothetical protein